jgi:hypothetical protein
MPDIGETLGLGSLDMRRFEVVLARLILAGLLGAFLGYRLWRRLLPDTLPPTREIAQAQTLIAIAGALMVVVIGQSTARAFGLVGLGGFIRFRSGIKDTRDAAVMFVMIGVGMACGLGAVPMAVVATLFVSVVLAIFDAGQRARLRLRRVTIEIAHPHAAWKRIQLALPGSRALELPGESSPEVGRLVIEAVIDETMDASGLLTLLEARQVQGIRGVTLDENNKAG